MLMLHAEKLDCYEFLAGSRNIGWHQWARHKVYWVTTNNTHTVTQLFIKFI